MGKYDDVELHGAERERVIAAIQEQVAAWGLTMPAVEPLILDMGLGRFAEVGDSEYWIANEEKLGYCGKFLFMCDGQTCPHHYHNMKHETFYILKGRIRMRMGEEEFIMNQGDVLPMPPGTKHSFTGLGNALILEVSLPSVLDDNFFDDREIGNRGVI